jgi:hypothetical protein
LINKALGTKLLGAIAISMFCSSASFARNEEKVGQVGPFTILRVYDGNDSLRCVAALGSGRSLFRFSVSYDKKYAISVPGVAKSNNLMMYIEAPESDDISFPARSDGTRTFGDLDAKQFRNFLRNKKEIVVHVENTKYVFPIGNTSLAEVAKRTEQCNN